MESTKSQMALKVSLSSAVLIITIAAYIAFGFFFDVFVEIIPILLFPFIVLPIILFGKRDLNKIAAIISTIILFVLSIAASSAVGVISTSKPAYGIKPICGSVSNYYYEKSFMKENYDINQKTKIDVWLPDNYDESKKYPIIFVLDGDMLFNYTAVKAAEHSANGDGDVIVVGIGYGYWNSTFARGGIIWQDEKNVRGRWRDFCFADDTQAGYMPGTDFGGESKRGKEYTTFIYKTVVPDIREKYSIDNTNSTVFGHSLGGGMVAYFLTQYNPSLKENNPFTNFIIVDNGYLDYYNSHFVQLESAMSNNGNVAHSEINIYRIWGGTVNPPANNEQYALYEQINSKDWTDINNYFWIPEGANHSDTQTIGIDNALLLTLKMDFQKQTTYENLP